MRRSAFILALALVFAVLLPWEAKAAIRDIELPGGGYMLFTGEDAVVNAPSPVDPAFTIGIEKHVKATAYGRWLADDEIDWAPVEKAVSAELRRLAKMGVPVSGVRIMLLPAGTFRRLHLLGRGERPPGPAFLPAARSGTSDRRPPAGHRWLRLDAGQRKGQGVPAAARLPRRKAHGRPGTACAPLDRPGGRVVRGGLRVVGRAAAGGLLLVWDRPGAAEGSAGATAVLRRPVWEDRRERGWGPC